MKIIIVGAGPSGSSAGYFLAKGGVNVTVLDRATFPRDKVCGDGLSSRAFYTLFRMGLPSLDAFRYPQKIVNVALFDWYGKERAIDAPSNLFGHPFSVIPRKDLDFRLLEQAKEAGVTIRERVRIREIRKEKDGFSLIHSGGEETCDILIGADGINSLVRSSVFRSRFREEEKSFAMRAYIRNVKLTRPESYYFVYLREIFPGYGWIFPLPGGRANVGFGLPADRLRKSKKNAFEYWEEFLRHTLVRKELEGGIWESSPKGHYIPMRVGSRDLYQDRAYLCGDAAGLVDPITGDGIDFALESGALVAEDILQTISLSKDLKGLGNLYRSRLETTIRKRLRFEERMKTWVFRKSIFDRIFRYKKDEKINFNIARLLLGQTGFWELIDTLKRALFTSHFTARKTKK